MAKRYKIHRFAELLPPMTDEEYAALRASVKREEGNTVPTLVWGGVILDGRHRERACEEEEQPHRVQEWRPKSRDPIDQELEILDLIEERNLTRRTSLSASQRAHFVALLDKERRELMRQQGVGAECETNGEAHEQSEGKQEPQAKNDEKPQESSSGGNPPPGKPTGNRGNRGGTRSRARSAKVDKTTQKAADDCVEKGSESLNKAIQAKKLKVSDAVLCLDRKHAEQDKLVALVESGDCKTIKQALAKLDGSTPFDEPLTLCCVVLENFVPKMQEHARIIQRALGSGAGQFTASKIDKLAGQIFEEFKAVKKVLEHAQKRHATR